MYGQGSAREAGVGDVFRIDARNLFVAYASQCAGVEKLLIQKALGRGAKCLS